jgi:hypothetical protein
MQDVTVDVEECGDACHQTPTSSMNSEPHQHTSGRRPPGGVVMPSENDASVTGVDVGSVGRLSSNTNYKYKFESLASTHLQGAGRLPALSCRRERCKCDGVWTLAVWGACHQIKSFKFEPHNTPAGQAPTSGVIMPSENDAEV